MGLHSVLSLFYLPGILKYLSMPYVCFLICNVFHTNIISLKHTNITDKYNSELSLSFVKFML